MISQSQAPDSSLLLRLWCTRQDGQVTWTSALETIPGGEQWAFPDLPSLLTFLQTHVAELEKPEQAEPDQPDSVDVETDRA